MIILFRDIFGDDFINNTAIVLTNWEQSKRARKERAKDEVSEKSKSDSINAEIRNMGF